MSILRSHLLQFALLLATLPLLLPDTAFAEDLSAKDLLGRIEAAREEPEQIHYKVRISVLTEYAGQPQERIRSEKFLDFVVV